MRRRFQVSLSRASQRLEAGDVRQVFAMGGEPGARAVGWIKAGECAVGGSCCGG